MSVAQFRPRFRAPALLVRGEDSPIEIEVWNSVGVQEPTSGSVTIVDASGAVIVSDQALTVDTDTKRAGTVIDSTDLPSTLSFSDRWRVTWTMVLAGETVKFKQDAQLILNAWYPTVTPADLMNASPTLGSAFDLDNPDDVEALSKYIQSAVELAQGRLVSNGKRAWLIFDPWRLNEYVTNVTLGRIYRSNLFDTEPSTVAAIEKLAIHHEGLAASSWAEMGFTYDASQAGLGESVKPAQGPAPIRIGRTRSVGVGFWR